MNVPDAIEDKMISTKTDILFKNVPIRIPKGEITENTKIKVFDLTFNYEPSVKPSTHLCSIIAKANELNDFVVSVSPSASPSNKAWQESANIKFEVFSFTSRGIDSLWNLGALMTIWDISLPKATYFGSHLGTSSSNNYSFSLC